MGKMIVKLAYRGSRSLPCNDDVQHMARRASGVVHDAEVRPIFISLMRLCLYRLPEVQGIGDIMKWFSRATSPDYRDGAVSEDPSHDALIHSDILNFRQIHLQGSSRQPTALDYHPLVRDGQFRGNTPYESSQKHEEANDNYTENDARQIDYPMQFAPVNNLLSRYQIRLDVAHSFPLSLSPGLTRSIQSV